MKIAHVFPFDPRHLSQDFHAWLDAQLVRWPIAAVARSRFATASTVHVIGPHNRRAVTPPMPVMEHRSLTSGPRFRDWGDDWSRSLARSIKRLGHDDVCVVHLNDYSAARLAERAATRTRVAIVFHGRGLRGWETADALVVLHEDARQELCEAGADPQRVHVLSPSVDLGLFHPAEASRNGLKLGFVGRLEESKGIAELPRVLQRVPEAQIEVAGGGDAAISGTVLLGELPASEVAKRMRAWRVLLLPSHTEGYPRVVAEAAASGLPVAAVTGVLPSELERQPGIHVAARPDYPELVAHLVTQAPTERRADWVHSHDDAAQAWDELLDRLPPWRVRARPSLCRRSRLRRFRPPRRVARRVLRRSVAPRGSRLSIGAAACWCLQRLTNGNSSGCNGSGASVSLD